MRIIVCGANHRMSDCPVMAEVRNKHKTTTIHDKIGLIHSTELHSTYDTSSVYDHPHPGWLYLVDDSGSNRILIRNRRLLRDF